MTTRNSGYGDSGLLYGEVAFQTVFHHKPTNHPCSSWIHDDVLLAHARDMFGIEANGRGGGAWMTGSMAAVIRPSCRRAMRHAENSTKGCSPSLRLGTGVITLHRPLSVARRLVVRWTLGGGGQFLALTSSPTCGHSWYVWSTMFPRHCSSRAKRPPQRPNLLEFWHAAKSSLVNCATYVCWSWRLGTWRPSGCQARTPSIPHASRHGSTMHRRA